MNNLIRSAAGLYMLVGVCSMGWSTVEASSSVVNIEVCNNDFNEKIEADIKDRLSAMNGLVEMKFTPEVMSYIKGYLRYKEGSSAVLGRQATYFPIFEDVLLRNNLPTDLKYLSIVESSLKPNAYSKVGAAGLWQFMRGTGKMMGLKINRTVDERKNPYKSTEAAANYLQMLYDEFGDWTLALAAYNSGPGRVRGAIRKGDSRDFWTIRKYLPRETRNYVPAFIAVNYLANYYYLHDIQPTLEHPDFMSVTNVTLYESMTFEQIQEITGVSGEVLKQLNPCYLRNYVPESITGSYILLPNYAATLLLHHLYRPDTPDTELHEILADNTLLTLSERRLLRLPVSVADKLPTPLTTPVMQKEVSLDDIMQNHARLEEDHVWYRLKKRESLFDIAKREKVSFGELLELNDTLDNELSPGSLVRLR